jgi:hypothetical protein
MNILIILLKVLKKSVFSMLMELMSRSLNIFQVPKSSNRLLNYFRFDLGRKNWRSVDDRANSGIGCHEYEDNGGSASGKGLLRFEWEQVLDNKRASLRYADMLRKDDNVKVPKKMSFSEKEQELSS